MITAQYCQVMARYNSWQNRSLVTAADTLGEAERRKNRGAFFHSIAETFEHLYWADIIQLRRILGEERPHETLGALFGKPIEWSTFKDLRATQDGQIEAWAAGLDTTDLSGLVSWYSPSGGQRIEKPRALCLVQLFNHQTHHRGQVHAMLTAAGATPEPTDVAVMPG